MLHLYIYDWTLITHTHTHTHSRADACCVVNFRYRYERIVGKMTKHSQYLSNNPYITKTKIVTIYNNDRFHLHPQAMLSIKQHLRRELVTKMESALLLEQKKHAQQWATPECQAKFKLFVSKGGEL